MRATGEPREVCDLYLQEFYEAQQGKSAIAPSARSKPVTSAPVIDCRREKINASNLRNDLQVFSFDPDAAALGTGGARITDVAFMGEDGERLGWVVGGEAVTLAITVDVLTDLVSPIVGFYIRDKLGQTLFGDNTYLVYESDPIACSAGQQLVGRFDFRMPTLPNGQYSINAAVADGTQSEHVQLHWIHDALIFKSESSSLLSGLVGVPMQSIELKRI